MRWLGTILLRLGVLLAVGCVHVKSPTPTPRPTSTPRIVAKNTVDTPTSTAAMLASYIGNLAGDPVAGERLFHAFQPSAGAMCMACHRTDSDDRLVGPGLKNIAIRAQTRVEGQSAELYHPQLSHYPIAYVVDGYPNLMQKNWGASL